MNHRQAQAVWTVLAHQIGLADDIPTTLLGFEVHRDVD
jgi:hypothetical protein